MHLNVPNVSEGKTSDYKCIYKIMGIEDLSLYTSRPGKFTRLKKKIFFFLPPPMLNSGFKNFLKGPMTEDITQW